MAFSSLKSANVAGQDEGYDPLSEFAHLAYLNGRADVILEQRWVARRPSSRGDLAERALRSSNQNALRP